MDNWIKANYDQSSHYLRNDELKGISTVILISYRTFSGRNYVTTSLCDHGFIQKKRLNGIITAFMFMPKAFKE